MNVVDLAGFFPGIYEHIFCYDSSYARPSTEWLFQKFYPWFKEERRKKSKGIWTRKNDCDNFARTFCVYAQDAHADTTQGDDALAVGEFCYVGQTHVQGPHVIVCAITEQGLVFIEPQSGQRLALTPNEIKSCFRISF